MASLFGPPSMLDSKRYMLQACVYLRHNRLNYESWQWRRNYGGRGVHCTPQVQGLYPQVKDAA